MKTAKKRVVLRMFWLINRQNAVFCSKVLNKIYSRDFFEEYMNFETHYLSHCRVIPLQNFGSHIRPQPHGLGLRTSNPYKKENKNFKKLPPDSFVPID
jgi:hypothetical protein